MAIIIVIMITIVTRMISYIVCRHMHKNIYIYIYHMMQWEVLGFAAIPNSGSGLWLKRVLKSLLLAHHVARVVASPDSGKRVLQKVEMLQTIYMILGLFCVKYMPRQADTHTHRGAWGACLLQMTRSATPGGHPHHLERSSGSAIPMEASRSFSWTWCCWFLSLANQAGKSATLWRTFEIMVVVCCYVLFPRITQNSMRSIMCTPTKNR